MTMFTTTATTTLLLFSFSLLVGLTSGFHASLTRRPAALMMRPSSSSPRKTKLFSSVFPLLDPSVGEPPSEADATYLMAKAQECAFSDSATVADAKYYLRELVHIQSGCVVGTLASRSLCDNQIEVADIVVHLQSRLDAGLAGSASVTSTHNSASSMYTPFQMDTDGTAVLKQPVSLQLAVLGLVSAAFIGTAKF